MKVPSKSLFSALLVLAVLALAAALFTKSWGDYHARLRAMRAKTSRQSAFVDTRPLDTAQQIAQLAVTHTEHDYAQQALRLADHSVDLAFAAAVQDAADNPTPLTPETRAIQARIQAAQASVNADQDGIGKLNQQIAKARGSAKGALQEQLDLANAQLELDQDDLEDARQAFINSGADKQATIQKLREQHDASQAHAAATGKAVQAGAEASPEATESHALLAEFRALLSLRAKEKLMATAQENALARQQDRTTERDNLAKQIADEKAQKKITHKHADASAAPAVPQTAETPTSQTSPPQAAIAPPNATGDASGVTFVRELAQDQKKLSALEKRIDIERDLAATYASWIAFVNVREQAFLHEVFVALFWIFLIGLLIVLANQLIHRFFSSLKADARELHAVRAAVLVTVQALGVILILLVIFGPPSQLGTVIALAGAGLTVVLKDFIVGFLGWFILMGQNGIRPGDWVEINGVGGEVLEVGLLHTVLLETGNWSDASHPTGRKVTFTNSFAIEGHYFNFSTSGQWLWDELQVLVPESSDPYQIGEAIRKIATAETAENARQAEEEWKRAVPITQARRDFSAAPSISVRPGSGGVNVLVRYLTRARDRQQVRARLYQTIVELLHGKNVPGEVSVRSAGPGSAPAPAPVAPAAKNS
jgi:small-conductance mechanosensitive channel